jgi:MFS family permease
LNGNTHNKTGYYWLEGLNAFGSAFFFVSLMYWLHLEHHFSDLQKLALGAIHGFLYIPSSWYGGRFAQRHGYFAALFVGFGGMFAGIVTCALWSSLLGHFVGFVLWTVAMCFTWAPLEALVSEREAPTALANRVGLYNVVWSIAGAAGGFLSRWIFEAVGPSSLYWVPALLHLIQLVALPVLKRRHDTAYPATLASHGTESHSIEASRANPVERKPRYFLKLAWLANPFSYMAINTVMVVAPTITQQVGLPSATGAMWASTWLWSRTLGFFVMWKWHGWHYRFSWFITAFVGLLAGFAAIMVSHQLWQFVVAQVVFGAGTALIYYSSLFYSMDGSDAHGEHGGVHEALLGAGICGGPAVSAVSLWLAPSFATGPAWVVSAVLTVGVVAILAVRKRAMTANHS